jgi:Periplasmic binding protein-like domain
MRSGAADRTSASPAAVSRTSSGRPARCSPRTVSPPTGEGRIGRIVSRPAGRSGVSPRVAVSTTSAAPADHAALSGRLLDLAQPPTAVVCVSDVMALGALRAVEDRDLRAGVEVAVTGFDDSPPATVVRPGLTSVRQPLEAVAERVLEVLLDHVGGSRTDPARVLLDPALVVRDSSDRGGPLVRAATRPRARSTTPRVRSDGR